MAQNQTKNRKKNVKVANLKCSVRKNMEWQRIITSFKIRNVRHENNEIDVEESNREEM